MAIQFGWDPLKAKSNLRKHGVAFEEAITAFTDRFSETIPEHDHSYEEERFVMLGMSARRRLIVVSYTERDGRIRLISARLATPRERKIYEEY